ncbi:MAG: glutamate-1-semialdehyde 2,1-aminomutase [Acidobacteriota bacterium]
MQTPSSTQSPGPLSERWFQRALQVLPGGVNSPVRAFRSVGGTPVVVERAQGAEIVSVDGRQYLDFVGSWGPLILGHAHPEIVSAVTRAAARGTTYGAPCPGEVELAERVTAAYPGLEQIRCTSSGTEAVMSATRLARGVTGRDLIIKFTGCYHGHADHLLVAAGSGLATFGHPSSDGVPAAMVRHTRVLPLDDEAAVEELFREEGDRIAAVLIEPLPANNGLLEQRPDYLRALRRITREHGALLIFDEVISGFRIARGGAAERYGVEPDLVTFGKVVGGGLPMGAYGGRRSLMDHLAPSGGVYQAGTLSGNPLAMAAGTAALDVLERDGGWQRLETLGQQLEALLEPVLADAPVPIRLVRVGSIFWMHFTDERSHVEPPRTAASLDAQRAATYGRLFHQLLDRGIALAPSMYEVGFLSLAHRVEHLERLADALSASFEAWNDESEPAAPRASASVG